MGNVIHEAQALRLEDMPGFVELCETDLTVLRSANADHTELWEQSGWHIDSKGHGCGRTKVWEYGKALPSDSEFKWKVFLSNADTDPNTHACGWRRIGTFWPTGLAAELRDAWHQELARKIEQLADKETSDKTKQ